MEENPRELAVAANSYQLLVPSRDSEASGSADSKESKDVRVITEENYTEIGGIPRPKLNFLVLWSRASGGVVVHREPRPRPGPGQEKKEKS